MSPGNTHNKQSLNLAERKQLLLVACTIDRLSLLTRLAPPGSHEPWVSQFTQMMPWMNTVMSLATTFLPRKLRILTKIWRLWSNARGAR